MFPIFKQCCHPQEVWGLRRLCLQLAPELVEFLDPAKDTEALKFILDFLQVSLKKQSSSADSGASAEKWVRVQAMQNFGQIVHACHLKNEKRQLSGKINEVCRFFYDLEFLKAEKVNIQAEDSFMSDDESEKIKEMWAFHMPCVLLVQKSEFWPTLKQIYQEIYTDIAVPVKRSLAASFLEITKLHLDEQFMTPVLQSFATSPVEEVRQKVYPHLIPYIKLTSQNQLHLVQTLIKPLLDEKPEKPSFKHSVARASLLE